MIKNPTFKLSLIVISTVYNLILWGLFVSLLWKAAFIYKDGMILVAFNNYGEMYNELIIAFIFLISILPVSLYIIKDYIKEMGK